MERNFPLISIIIPCRNEENFIKGCLDSIIVNNYPKDKLEVLVIDGMSNDKTKEIVKRYVKQYSFISFLENHRKFTPFGLNIGIKEAKGEIIIRMDAHAIYEKDYILKCTKFLKEYNADNVGGVTEILPSENTLLRKAIALSLSNSFGVGNAYYKSGYSKEPRWVDTVFCGCYKKEVFEKIGLFNENLIRSQDIEFNLRLRNAGGKILLVPSIRSYYYTRHSLKDFFLYNFKNGVWVIYSFKFVKMPLRLRHYIPLIFVSSLLGTGLLGFFFPVFFWLILFITELYLLVNIYFSAKIAIREKNWKYFFVMPIVFAARHIGYGSGSILGIIKLFI